MSEIMGIRSIAELSWFLHLCGQEKILGAELECDINAEALEENLLGEAVLQGTFDGRGHTIHGLKHGELFYHVAPSGMIKNLTLEGNVKHGAPFCRFNEGVITDCVSKVNSEYATGFCGYMQNGGKLINCRNEGNVKYLVFFYNFVTLGFDLDKLQFVRRLGEDTVYENNIAAGSFEPISGYSIPIEVIQEERMEQGTYLSEEADKILFGLDCPYTDKEGRTWLHQFVDVLARSRFYQESKIDFVSEEPWISRVIKEIALYSDIDFNAKDKNGRTAVDCLRDYDGKMLPNTAHIKELISAIAEERGKAR